MTKVIFDFDGVILDSFSDQFLWFKHISEVLDKEFPYSNIDEFRKDYREPVYPDMYEFLGLEWEKNKSIIWDEYNAHKPKNEVPIFEGIDKVIEELYDRNFTLAIASSNTHKSMKKQLHTHGLDKYFDIIVGKEDLPVENGDPLLKPHPATLLLALDKLGCMPSEAVYIGDHSADILAASAVAEHRENPVPIIAVSYGYVEKEKLVKLRPDYLVDSPEEILAVIEKFYS